MNPKTLTLLHSENWAVFQRVKPNDKPHSATALRAEDLERLWGQRKRNVGTLRDSFFSQIQKLEDGCWNWTGFKAGRNSAYGGFSLNSHKSTGAHRVSYVLHKGDIEEGMTIDHLCRNPLCVNPEHLDMVTTAENNRRLALTITHCPQGHEYTPENSFIRYGGGRQCKSCSRETTRAWRARIRSEKTSR